MIYRKRKMVKSKDMKTRTLQKFFLAVSSMRRRNIEIILTSRRMDVFVNDIKRCVYCTTINTTEKSVVCYRTLHLKIYTRIGREVATELQHHGTRL